MIPLSAVIIAKDEERNIGRCLASLRGVADEVVVVDSYSTDGTARICRDAGARLIEHPFAGHVQQKNWALTQAKHPHVLSLDADEALTPELAASITRARADWSFEGYTMNRLTSYCGVWVRHCGWYPDPKLRLFDSRKGAWGGVNPHDHFELKDRKAPTGNLAGDLLHYSYYSVDDHYRQMEYFAGIAARELAARGAKASRLRPATAAAARFIRNYVLRRGFLDGLTGLRVCQVDAWGAWRKYDLLRSAAMGGGTGTRAGTGPRVPGPPDAR